MAHNAADGVAPFSDDEWTRAVSGLESCGARIVDVLQSALKAGGLRPHSVIHRVKKRDDTEKKIMLKARDDYTIADLTDLLGIRVITYFDDEVDGVAEIVRPLFEIDPDNSVDKRTSLEPDRFGYSSLHYVARLGAARTQMTEYAPFKELAFEIQIRSILQHAWAEIEHDLGYKSEHARPEWLKRRFARLAGVLELAGDEFVAIRDRAVERRAEVETAVTSVYQPEPGIPTPVPPVSDVQIDRDSVEAYIRGSARLAEVENWVVEALHRPYDRESIALDAGFRASELRITGFTTLREVDAALGASDGFLSRFMTNWLERPEMVGRPRRPLTGGIALLYLAIVRVLDEPEDRARELMADLDLESWALERLQAELRRARATGDGHS